MNLTRTIVIGNSGSGKSWLAERIAHQIGTPWTDLDLIHWEPGGYNVARSRALAMSLAKEAASSDRWVIEGVYGWLVREIASQATALVWLCLDEAECIANIRQRGMRGESEASFTALVDWAQTYRMREGSTSYAAHQAIFDSFSGPKTCLRHQDEVTEFAKLTRSL